MAKACSSVVPENAVVKFDLKKPPYSTYKASVEVGRRFVADPAIIRATKFVESGLIPFSLAWMYRSDSRTLLQPLASTPAAADSAAAINGAGEAPIAAPPAKASKSSSKGKFFCLKMAVLLA